MKQTIKVKTNGYWISENNLYLDNFEYKTNVNISFDEFERKFYPTYLDDYNLEWKGNNPFMKDECLRLWISDNARVEIFVNNRRAETIFSIYKVLIQYNSSDELLLDLAKVGILYKDVLNSFEQYVKDYGLEKEHEDAMV